MIATSLRRASKISGNMSNRRLMELMDTIYIKEMSTELIQLFHKNEAAVMKLPLSYNLHLSLFGLHTHKSKDKLASYMKTIIENMHVRTMIDYIYLDVLHLVEMICFVYHEFEDDTFIINLGQHLSSYVKDESNLDIETLQEAINTFETIVYEELNKISINK